MSIGLGGLQRVHSDSGSAIPPNLIGLARTLNEHYRVTIGQAVLPERPSRDCDAF
jgi:hypothetical protein